MDFITSESPRSAKSRKGTVHSTLTTGSPAPTKFFLKTERELDMMQKENDQSRETSISKNGSELADSSFGVQSLEDTIRSSFSSDNDLSRTTSNESDGLMETSPSDTDDTTNDLLVGRERRAGKNRVHPTILATGQRILSSERVPTLRTTLSSSPAPLPVSPLVPPPIRRSSGTSSANISQPLTPIRLSPRQSGAVTPSTARSGSPKSFRLSDEEGSMADEMHSQAIMSSSEEDEEHQVERTPQLVMPSLAMPARRPFTEQGRQIGKAKIMVVGPKGVGKTSFLNSVFRVTEHIVHIEQSLGSLPSKIPIDVHAPSSGPTFSFNEIHASTKPYPAWWTDIESRRSRRNSIGTSILERNLVFIDTPGLNSDDDVRLLLDRFRADMCRSVDVGSMSENVLVDMLSGNGGVQVDVVLYLFEPELANETGAEDVGAQQQELIRNLSKWTNLIPLIGRADTVTREQLQLRKQQISDMLDRIGAKTYDLPRTDDSVDVVEPLSISSAVYDDAEVIDASVLMSSQYVRPLSPSELGVLANALFMPTNISRMRHLSAVKFATWKRQNWADHTKQEHVLLQSPSLRSHSPGVASNGSLLEDPNKILVPYSSSRQYRSASPGNSEWSTPSHNPPAASSSAFRRVRLEKWAQDLFRNKTNERHRQQEGMCKNRPSHWGSDGDEGSDQALVLAKGGMAQPGRGRLGGELGVFDPQDPLGILALGQTIRRQGFVLLQVAGTTGLLGAFAYWMVKNGVEVQELFGLQPPGVVSTVAVPAPGPRSFTSWVDETLLRGFFGWNA